MNMVVNDEYGCEWWEVIDWWYLSPDSFMICTHTHIQTPNLFTPGILWMVCVVLLYQLASLIPNP
jgi:hypothetical protein